MERASQMGHRSVPPKLTLPASRPHLSFSASSRHYPAPTPAGKSSFLFSPAVTPTPSKHIRASDGPFWIFTLLELLSLYAVHKWLASFDTAPPLALFSFFALLGSAVSLITLHRSWKGRKVLSYQWGLLVGSGGIWALSLMLRFQGLRSCGPLETILAEFAGALGGKVFFESWQRNSDKSRKARGLMALVIAVFLLSQGWARASCSPLAFDVGYRNRGLRSKINVEPKDCVKLFWIFSPTLAGVLSAFQKSMATRSSLKVLGKNRVHTLTHATAALILFPFAVLQITLMAGQSRWLISGSVLWPWFSTVALGMVLASYGDAYEEKKLLLPAYSFKAFLVVSCCVCVLELLYGLDISLLGFLFCTSLLGIGVQELSLVPGNLVWEGLGDGDSTSLVYSSWVKSPVWHIVSDKKSRKIAMFLLINAGFMVIEFFFGFLSNSLGLISDACHMLFDCAALAIGLYASYISRLPANSRFNYGYGRFEIVSGYANAVLLVLVASLIVLESIERMLEPPEISTESLLVVSVGGLLVNIVGLIFFHDEHHHAHGVGGSHSHSHHEAGKSSRNFAYSTVDSKHDEFIEHSIVDCGTASLHPHANSSHQIHQANQFSPMNHEKGCDHGLLGRQSAKVYSSHGPHHISSSHGNVEASTCNPLNYEHKHMESDLSLSLIEGHAHEAGHSIGCSSTSSGVNGKSHAHEHECTSDTHSHFHGSHDQENDDLQGPGHAGFSNSSKHHVNHLLSEDTDHDCSVKELEKHRGHHNEQGIKLPEQIGSGSKGQAGEDRYHDHHHSNSMNTKSDQCELHGHDHCLHLVNHQHSHDLGNHNHQHGDHHHQHSNHDPHDHHSNYMESRQDQHHLHGHDHHLHQGNRHHQHDDHHHHKDGNHIHHHNGDHHDHMDHNMQGIFLHVLADTLGSVGVVISTLLIKYKGWLITDPACSIFISVLIISSVVPLLRNSAEVLLQRMPRFNESGLKQAVNDIGNNPGIRNYQRVHIWSFTNKEIVGSVHLQVSPRSDKRMIRRSVSQLLHNAGIVDLTVQLEDT